MVFEIIDLVSDDIVPRISVEAVTPEEAVLRALGVEVNEMASVGIWWRVSTGHAGKHQDGQTLSGPFRLPAAAG